MVVPELPPFRAWEKPIQNRDEMGLGIRLRSLWQGAQVSRRTNNFFQETLLGTKGS